MTTDRLFASLELAKKLKSNGLNLLGPLTAKRNYIPSAFVTDGNRELYSLKYGFNNDATRISFKDKRLVLILSSRKEYRNNSRS